MDYLRSDLSALRDEYEKALAEYGEIKRAGLSLDMSRGRPGAEQLELSEGMLGVLGEGDRFAEDGTDCRNYGGLNGIPEMRRLFAEMLNVRASDVIAGGNSSLSLMFDCVSAFAKELWKGEIKFICPVPGYDRHFAICEYLGIKMAPVRMTPDGPDIGEVSRLAASDPAFAGMWCVPAFSNPDGSVYSRETARALSSMKAANENFRLIWDNAYSVHNFRGERPEAIDILGECERAGNPERPVAFASFSKISFAGSSVAASASSDRNRAILLKRLSTQTVGPDKLNQLRHARYFKDLGGVLSHMGRNAEILRPKFDLVEEAFTRELSGEGCAKWTRPDGGYFVSFDMLLGSARRAAALCSDAGVKVTEAGATFPYGDDPQDKNIRIAPTSLRFDELRPALRTFCVSVRLAALEGILHK